MLEPIDTQGDVSAVELGDDRLTMNIVESMQRFTP